MSQATTTEPESTTGWAQKRDSLNASGRSFLADPQRNVIRAGIALIVAQFVIRFTMAMRGWFVGDDYAFIGRSWEFSSPSLTYLSLPYAGHVMPGSWLWVWICSHLAPYNFLLPTLADAAVQAATSVVVLRLLIALFDRRWAVLAPFALFLFTVINLPAFVWWAAALNQAPLQLAVAGALLNHVQYLKTGDVRRGWAAVGCLVFGLAFSEKTILVSGVVFGLTFAYFTAGPFVERLRTVVTRHWRVWAAYVAVCAPYLIYYAIYVPSPIIGKSPDASGISALAGNQVFRAIIPAFFGGPWEWSPLGTNAAMAAPSDLMVQVCTVLFAAVVGLSVFLHHRAAFAWILLLGFETVNCALLALSRARLVGPSIGLEFRYSTDVALVAMLCGALAFLPISAAFADRQPLLPRAGSVERLREIGNSDLLSVFPTRRVGPVVAALVTLVVASSIYSSWKYTDYFGPNAGKTLIHNARADAARQPDNAAVADTPVDERAVWNFVYPYTLPSRLLRPLDVDLPYATVGQATENLVILDPEGRFGPAAIKGYTADPGPEVNCGYRVGSKPTSISMPAKTPVPWDWTIRIGYLATGTGTTTVRAASTTMKVTVHKGPGTMYLPVRGTVHHIRFGGLSNRVQFCTNDVAVGTPISLDAPGGIQ